MVRTRLLRLALYTAILVAALHVLAVVFFLYWSYWWFDMPLHLLGGFSVGLFSLWIFGGGRRAHYPPSSLRVLSVAVSGALVVGLAWEFFEYSAGLTFDPLSNYTLDTVKDLTMDVVGGYLAHLYFFVKGYQKSL
ncbi:MAG: hypothetical protein HYV67_00780 [Candidatus Taylorbacteria bacterium]|nr:hypothetical protein [Candidatus Taylorbacteria bacterium]